MKRGVVFGFMFLIGAIVIHAQQILDNYVQEGLENNIALKQKEYSYKKSLEELKEARRMFLPVVSIEAGYSRNEGGRTIELPYGDMMNPVYSNLNAINTMISQMNPSYQVTSSYPEIENYSFKMLRETEQETKVQLSMPLFNAKIMQNCKIQSGLASAQLIDVDIYKRELVKEIKVAYAQYLQSVLVLDMYNQTLETVNYNLQSRESLFKHDKITKDEVYAARAKVKEVEKNITQSTKDSVMSAAYFNFLLNKPLQSDITQDSTWFDDVHSNTTTSDSVDVEKREEILQMKTYLNVQDHKISIRRNEILPEVALGVSYGYQGEEYAFDSEHDFATVGVKMSWTLFSSGQRSARVQQEKINRSITAANMDQLKINIRMDMLDAQYSLQTADKGIEQALEELDNYNSAFKLVEIKYREGMANYVEFSNALDNKVNAQSKLIVAQYEYLKEAAVLERVQATYVL